MGGHGSKRATQAMVLDELDEVGEVLGTTVHGREPNIASRGRGHDGRARESSRCPEELAAWVSHGLLCARRR